MSARPTTPSSPKTVKVKEPVAGMPMFGCEHIEQLFGQGQETINTSIFHYKIILRKIFDQPPIVPQTSKLSNDQPVTTLTPNYLCLQCPTTLRPEDINKHGNVESRCGVLYCHMCDDLVYDPTLEELRLRKIGTGTFSTNRKRKHDELFSTDALKDDPRYIASNTTLASCRASGLRGIYNAGATCYQNVILQSFLHNPLLRNFYLSDGHQSSLCESPYCLSCAMDDVFQEFYGGDTTNGYTAANILSSFWISEKKAFANLVTTKEQDAHEFFQFLAEELHERNGDGKKPEHGSEHSCTCVIHQTFYGKLQSTTTCQQCYGVTHQVQSFLDLSLGVDNLRKSKKDKGAAGGAAKLTLQQCLDEEYIKSDKCEYRCHKCDTTRMARRHTSIKSLPNVLSIQLKRFEYKQGRHDKAVKVDTPVEFPLQLNMLPYTNRRAAGPGGAGSSSSGSSYELNRSCMYDLLSVVVHVGEIDTGHYVTYCRVGDQWFAFNDHRVELASNSEVLGAKAYLLFYIIRSLA
ncbi:ubiquitin carboxyl-terminal hydrolase-like protein [Ophiostoma piceae UAMH 11346]|uniref:Ubiquitin carboxyl-terminal hydrolase-like protein n=1 Tax=Ophiostoma piceae (strain UAMH 11346) TaxID=1262450 RepID=S3BSH5_OPHP1|nr:ubiquitin carboxyl-terminal hydrolase-like protein [Ophiostoma piceae UAMH 11346]